ncbi:hypothetical protein G9A89_017649 [Geosiphon pyriformis]|nr:hypothetical protein G9A89_017649 [Geosiphon pyriformis]
MHFVPDSTFDDPAINQPTLTRKLAARNQTSSMRICNGSGGSGGVGVGVGGDGNGGSGSGSGSGDSE